MASKKAEEQGSAHGGGLPETGAEERGRFEYFGCVYHLGVNSIGREYSHLRFLCIRGKYVEMYKRDPHENPGIKPIRGGVVGHTLMVEELGRRKLSRGDYYVLRFYNRLDETKKGEIACPTAGEARKWMEAFDQAKQQAEYELSRDGSVRNKLNMETEINLKGHRPRVRRYAHGLRRLIRIGEGPETLLRQTSNLSMNVGSDGCMHGDVTDVIGAHQWQCVRMENGIRMFEDVANSKSGKTVLVKAVGVVDASADTVFEVVLNVDRHQRCEWDMLTGYLELVDSLNGHYDVVYSTYDNRQLKRWHSKRDFVFSRQWFFGQDGTYTILQFPTVHKSCPEKSGYQRTKINPSTWEIRSLNSSVTSNGSRCVVTQMLEVHSVEWCKWKNNQCSKFEKTVTYALLSQVAGLKEYIGANPALTSQSSTTIVHSKFSDVSSPDTEYDDAEMADEFYDAISTDSSSDDEDKDNIVETNNKNKKVKLKNISWAIAGLALKRTSGPNLSMELDPDVPSIILDPSHFHCSMHQGKDESDTNCWTSPSGTEFLIRGKTYLKDNSKVKGGDPLLELIAVDWFKVENCISQVALHPSSLVQSQAGKKLPFILIVNLQVPARPNYSLVLYYASDRPVNKDSLLDKFVNGSDMFRDSRFKLIPRIVEGYWMVKRAVGTKACLLGKAVTCKYHRQDNFLEIDVEIGSSSVARSVISLVLGYVPSIVVDLAILIEAEEEEELPEYILGTVRLNRVKLESAAPFTV
ncbi:hypothetical protein ACSBR1_005546 [Camellia fascicularis]